jgi:hypothetical protein
MLGVWKTLEEDGDSNIKPYLAASCCVNHLDNI